MSDKIKTRTPEQIRADEYLALQDIKQFVRDNKSGYRRSIMESDAVKASFHFYRKGVQHGQDQILPEFVMSRQDIIRYMSEALAGLSVDRAYQIGCLVRSIIDQEVKAYKERLEQAMQSAASWRGTCETTQGGIEYQKEKVKKMEYKLLQAYSALEEAALFSGFPTLCQDIEDIKSGNYKP